MLYGPQWWATDQSPAKWLLPQSQGELCEAGLVPWINFRAKLVNRTLLATKLVLIHTHAAHRAPWPRGRTLLVWITPRTTGKLIVIRGCDADYEKFSWFARVSKENKTVVGEKLHLQKCFPDPVYSNALVPVAGHCKQDRELVCVWSVASKKFRFVSESLKRFSKTAKPNHG